MSWFNRGKKKTNPPPEDAMPLFDCKPEDAMYFAKEYHSKWVLACRCNAMQHDEITELYRILSIKNTIQSALGGKLEDTIQRLEDYAVPGADGARVVLRCKDYRKILGAIQDYKADIARLEDALISMRRDS
jgi:hypothetical protein